jgi:hypothetical protein
MKKILDLKFIESKQFFYSVLTLNIILLCFTRFYPSMDGASHLYNSNLIGQILKGNSTIKEFYAITSIPIPNWISHFILGSLIIMFPAWLAEKILLIAYVVGMAISFRFLLKQINRETTFLSVLIFPFIYSFLFHLGFYNFCLSFIFLFLTLGFYLKIQSKFKFYHYFFLFILLTLTYFSNTLIYGFLGLLLGLFIVFDTFENYKSTSNFNTALKFGLKRILFLFLAAMPSLIFLFVFFNTVTFFPSDQAYSIKELIKWLNDARPFIVYDYVGEEIYTEHYLHILLILIVIPFIMENERFSNLKIKKSDILFIPIIFSLILYFTTPNASNAGMMSDRYCLLVYIFGITWICTRIRSNKLSRILIMILIFLHIGLLIKHLNGTIKKLDRDAQIIYQTSKFINENSIVLPVNFSDNWLESHFSNYIGIDKPIIILENYEASVGWFPVKWNSVSLPNVLLGDKNSIQGMTWNTNPQSKKIRQIDYVLLYGNLTKINDENWSELKELLSKNFKIVYHSTDNFVMLYENCIHP